MSARESKSRIIDFVVVVNVCKKGSCFNWKEKWSKGHVHGKICTIEILEKEPLEVDQNELDKIGEEK